MRKFTDIFLTKYLHPYIVSRIYHKNIPVTPQDVVKCFLWDKPKAESSQTKQDFAGIYSAATA